MVECVTDQETADVGYTLEEKMVVYEMEPSAVTDGSLVEILNADGAYWKQGEQFPVWTGLGLED